MKSTNQENEVKPTLNTKWLFPGEYLWKMDWEDCNGAIRQYFASKLSNWHVWQRYWSSPWKNHFVPGYPAYDFQILKWFQKGLKA